MTTGNGFADRQQSTLAVIGDRWAMAQTAYAIELKKLYRDDGAKIYATKEHDLRQQAISSTLRKAADKAIADYQSVKDACDLQLQAISMDPLLTIHNSAQREEALYKREFVKETCQTAPMAYLTTQLIAMSSHGTAIERLLYVRYAGERLQATNGQGLPGWLEANSALGTLEGNEKVEERKGAESVRKVADRDQGRVNLDLYRMGVSAKEGVVFDDGTKSIAQRF